MNHGDSRLEVIDPETRRHKVIDVDTGEVIVTMLAFLGVGHVRMVCVAELQRDGYSLRREEAERWRDALTAALAEIDAYRADDEDRLTDAEYDRIDGHA